MLNIFGESAHYGHWTFCNILDFALFPQEYQASKKYFTYAVIVKFENSKTAFRNLENSKSDLPNFGIFEKLEGDKWMEPKKRKHKLLLLIKKWISDPFRIFYQFRECIYSLVISILSKGFIFLRPSKTASRYFHHQHPPRPHQFIASDKRNFFGCDFSVCWVPSFTAQQNSQKCTLERLIAVREKTLRNTVA